MSLVPLLGNFVNSIEKENPISSETIKKEAVQIVEFAKSQNIGFANHQLGAERFNINNSYQLAVPTLGIDYTYNLGQMDAAKLVTPSSNLAVFNITPNNNELLFKTPSYMIPQNDQSVYLATPSINDPMLRGVSLNDHLSYAYICERCGKPVTTHPTQLISRFCDDCSKGLGI